MELSEAGLARDFEFACSMRVARRIYQKAPNHRLETLIQYVALPHGRHHRALADAEMTARLVQRMSRDIHERYGIGRVTHDLLQKIQSCPKKKLEGRLDRYRREGL